MPPVKTYKEALLTFHYNFFFAMPALFIYEILIRIFHRSAKHNFGIFEFCLEKAGIWGITFCTLLITTAGLYYMYIKKKRGFEFILVKKYLYFMLVESLLLALILPTLILILNRFGFGLICTSTFSWWDTSFQVFFGAGFFEEFFFRFLLIYCVGYLILRHTITHSSGAVYLPLTILSAIIYTYLSINPLTTGQAFGILPLVQTMSYSIIPGLILIYRGFGITVWTHIFQDLFVMYLIWQTPVTYQM